MYFKFFILLILISLSLNANSFSQAKKLLLKKVYFDNQNTFYCLNKYSIFLVNNKYKTILEPNKNYAPRKPYFKSGKENYRTKNIEWEHIMPVENFGKHFACWKEGGRKACENNITFNEMESDMHNLVPSIGELNADRSNYNFGADKPRVGQYGKCKFKVDFKSKRA